MKHATAQTPDLTSALETLRSELVPVSQAMTVAPADAFGRILARDFVSAVDLPAFDCAAMDGFAVRAEDCVGRTRLHVTETILAGHPRRATVVTGTAQRITTGAPLSPGADAVVMREHARAVGRAVEIDVVVVAGDNVRRRGEHLAAGEVALPEGTHLGAAAIGLVAAAGATELSVVRPLRVGLASTGDELVDPPAKLKDAQSYDGSRPLLAAICRAAGLLPIDLGICPDDAGAFAERIERAAAQKLDALVVSGGTGLGNADVVRQAAFLRFLDLNVWPGRGIAFGTYEDRLDRLAIFGLPGNAVATFVMFHLLVLPALLHLAGARGRPPVRLRMPLAVDATAKAGRVEYQRARFESMADGQLAVRPLDQQGAAMLRTIVEADALIAVGPQPHHAAGDSVPVVPLAALRGH